MTRRQADSTQTSLQSARHDQCIPAHACQALNLIQLWIRMAFKQMCHIVAHAN